MVRVMPEDPFPNAVQICGAGVLPSCCQVQRPHGGYGISVGDIGRSVGSTASPRPSSWVLLPGNLGKRGQGSRGVKGGEEMPAPAPERVPSWPKCQPFLEISYAPGLWHWAMMIPEYLEPYHDPELVLEYVGVPRAVGFNAVLPSLWHGGITKINLFSLKPASQQHLPAPQAAWGAAETGVHVL